MDKALVQTIATLRKILFAATSESSDDVVIKEQLSSMVQTLKKAGYPDAMCAILHSARLNIGTVAETLLKFIASNGNN